MKKFIPLVTLLSIAMIVSECSAKPPEGERGKRRLEIDGQRQGPRRGQRQGGGPYRDPAEMVARMMKQFDKDGDQKLNVAELTAMFTTMRERRGSGRGVGQRKRPSSDRAPGERGGRNRKPGQLGRDDPGPAGGEKPKRPEAE